jgi:hypothetical protein
MLIRSISLFLAAVLFVGFFLPSSSLAMAQLQQQQQQTTTTTTTLPPSSSLSITTIPPLTPEEQEQQNRLQGVIAATTRDLNETEKQVSGVVFTPRWSEPIVWVNPNSIAVLVAYCLPGEFADSGQEILGGFGLEVLESYAIALPQGFMAWMAVVGNQADDVQQNGRRLPAALGVICASDLNNTESRILSPQEQQQINNINQQFTTIQNTQITNIDEVINVIDNVTGNTTTTTPPPQNGTGGVTEQPLRVEIVPNATEGVDYTRFRLEAKVTGGTEPYTYQWGLNDAAAAPRFPPGNVWEFILYAGENRFVTITVTDSKNQTASDSIQLTVERPFTAEIVTNATQAVAPATIRLDAHIFGGAPPYSYSWSVPDFGVIDQDRGITQMFFDPGTFTYTLSARDSDGQTVSDSVQIVIRERLGGGVLPPPETGQEGQPLGGALLPRTVPPTNVTGTASASATEPPLRVEAIANATQAVAPATIRFDANITGGAPPYSYSWSVPDLGVIDQDRSITQMFFEPGTFTYGLTVTDSRGKVVTDNVQIVISERGLPTEGIVAPEPGGIAPPPLEGGGVSPGVPEGGEGEEPEGGVSPPSTTEEQGGGGEEPSPPPPPDDTGEEGEGTPPSTTTEEEPTTPPEGGG